MSITVHSGTRLRLMLLFVLVIVCVPELGLSQAKKSVLVTGEVVDETGRPLESVNVQIAGTFDGDVTDSTGRFRFRTSMTGVQGLRASMIGYEPAIDLMDFSLRDSSFVRFVLKEALIKLEEVMVCASSYSTGDEVKGTTLGSLEVITTPSAAADILRAVQTFPGVVAVDEGSGLFVRGGDVSETVIFLDQATVVHPYKYESPTGGFFGTIPPFLVSGTYFSSGGFSARYGNALSGVLAMESLNLPSRLTWTLSAGLAAASVGVSVPIVPQKFGVRFSGNQSFTDLMLRLNGTRNQFTTAPRGRDVNLSVIYKYSNTGQVKLFNFVNTDEVGVRVDEPSFAGEYEGKETSWLHNLQWSDLVGSWLFKGSISVSRFTSKRQLGNMQFTPSDVTAKVRLDVDHALSEGLHLSCGGEIEQLGNSFRGTYPKNPATLDPAAEVYHLDEECWTTRSGSYAEIEGQISRRLIAAAGIRVDYYDLGKQVTGDPRLSLRYNFSNEANARVSWGLYQQFPQPFLLNEESGNPNLRAQGAQHLVVGFEYARDLLMIRLEAYQKNYRRLVLPSKGSNYTDRGNGFARGIDLFLKYGGFLQTPVSGWVSYSYLHSSRLQARDLVDCYLYEEAPSPYDITHNLTVVAKAQLIQFLSAGLTFRYATGRPVTPVVGAVFRQEGGYYEPIQGAVNSERLPNFARLDGSLSYFLPFGDANSVVFYLGVSNLLDRANPVRYEYSSDYSQRRLRTSDYRRFIYFGATCSIGTLGTDF